MRLRAVGRIPLPAHGPEGEFDHAAVDPNTDRLYVAHPSNDAVEVLDLRGRRHLRSLPGLRGVAGVWVDERLRLLFTSNRGENTASVFRLEPNTETELRRVPTGHRPNGMACDARRGVLLVAGVGNATITGAPPTLTFVDIASGRVLSTVTMPGRTRWALYHEPTDSFYVNVADPASVVCVRADRLTEISRSISIPAKGPHGLEQDPDGRTLYCACDEGVLMAVDPASGTTTRVGKLSGPPDVLWVSHRARRLYAAVGDPGVVDVFALGAPGPVESAATAPGAHTLTLDPNRDELHVFLPESHEDLVLKDEAE